MKGLSAALMSYSSARHLAGLVRHVMLAASRSSINRLHVPFPRGPFYWAALWVVYMTSPVSLSFDIWAGHCCRASITASARCCRSISAAFPRALVQGSDTLSALLLLQAGKRGVGRGGDVRDCSWCCLRCVRRWPARSVAEARRCRRYCRGRHGF